MTSSLKGSLPRSSRSIGEQDAAQEAADDNAAGALVGGEAVGLALRVVELLLAGFDVDVGVGEFAEVDFGAGDGEAGNGALDGHVAEQQGGQAFGGEAVDGVHGDAVAVGVDELLVDPVAAALGEFVDVEFAGGEHDLAQGAVEGVAVDVDVGKVVVGADLLDLAQGVLEGAPVPEADVLEGGLIFCGLGGFDGGFGGKLALEEAIEAEGSASHLDVVGDVGLLANEFVGFDDEVGDVPADYCEDEVTERCGSDGGDEPGSA